MEADHKNAIDLKKNRLFIISSLIIILVFVFIYFYFADTLNKPSACLCANSFSTDSAVSLRAAKQIVGNGHYDFTIQTARRDCLSAYQADMIHWEKTKPERISTTRDEAAFFKTICGD